jgi:hypothetical protein
MDAIAPAQSEATTLNQVENFETLILSNETIFWDDFLIKRRGLSASFGIILRSSAVPE